MNKSIEEQALEVCAAFVELFGESDMRPEDECHELFGKALEVLERAEKEKR